MVEAIRKDAKRQGLNMSHSFVPALPIGHHTWKLRNLGEPAAVVLAVNLDLEMHGGN